MPIETLEATVQKLSDGFTCRRPERFADYFASAETRSAYGLFFSPQSFVRTQLVLDELTRLRGWCCPKEVRILDVGAGLGACGMAAALFLRDQCGAQSVRLSALDHSPRALEDIQRCLRENAAEFSGITLENTFARKLPDFLKKAPVGQQGYDVIVAGFAFNELWGHGDLAENRQLIDQLGDHLSENGLLVVLEPALKETALALQAVSDLMAAEPRRLLRWGPYWGNFPCPLRAQGKYWAHEVRRWNPPESLRQLNRRLWREIGELKFHWAAWGRRPAPAADTTAHVLRLSTPFSKLKGRFEGAGVTPDGAHIRIDLPLKTLDKQSLDRCEQFERGDTLFLASVEVLEPTRWRIPSPEAITRHYCPR